MMAGDAGDRCAKLRQPFPRRIRTDEVNEVEVSNQIGAFRKDLVDDRAGSNRRLDPWVEAGNGFRNRTGNPIDGIGNQQDSETFSIQSLRGISVISWIVHLASCGKGNSPQRNKGTKFRKGWFCLGF